MKVLRKLVLIIFLVICMIVCSQKNTVAANQTTTGGEQITNLGAAVGALTGDQSKALSSASRID